MATAVRHSVRMNLQQLRSFREALARDFNLTAVADATGSSPSAVSRQLRDLEDELGVELFVRAGRRFLGLTAPGEAARPIVERLLHEAGNLRRLGADFADADRGLLKIAATHTQARYALPSAVRDFCAAHPQVSLHLQQGSPREVARQVLAGEADLGIATEALAEYPDLVALPCYRWTHAIVVPPAHPLAIAATRSPPSLGDLATWPLVTYEPGYTGRGHIDEAFARAGLEPRIVMQAMDADVIKTYAELGIGVGVIASVAYDAERDCGLTAIDARHLFAVNTTRVALRRGSFLRGYVHHFIETFAPTLTRTVVERALALPAGEPVGDG